MLPTSLKTWPCVCEHLPQKANNPGSIPGTHSERGKQRDQIPEGGPLTSVFIFSLCPHTDATTINTNLKVACDVGWTGGRVTGLTWDGDICHQQAIGGDAQETPIGGLQDDFPTIPVHSEEGVGLHGVPISYDRPVLPLERTWGPGTRSKDDNLSFVPITFSPGPNSNIPPAPLSPVIF